MNQYIFAFILCISCTVLSAIGQSTVLKHLIMSDFNVAIWLGVAWMFESYFRGRKA